MSAQATRRWEDDSLMLTQQHLCNASRGLLSAATRATCPPHGSPARDRALEEEARALALHRQELARLTAVIRVNQTFGAQRRAEIEADISRASTRCGHAEYEHFRSLSALHALQSVNEGVARATHGAAFADERERGAYIEDIARLHDSVRRRFSGRERDLLDRQIQRILRGPTNDSRPLGDRHNVAEQGAERDVLGARPRAPPDNNKRALTDGTGHAVPQGDADLAPPGAGREPLTSYTRPRVDYRKREPSLQGHAEPTTVDPWAPSGPHREAPDLRGMKPYSELITASEAQDSYVSLYDPQTEYTHSVQPRTADYHGGTIPYVPPHKRRGSLGSHARGPDAEDQPVRNAGDTARSESPTNSDEWDRPKNRPTSGSTYAVRAATGRGERIDQEDASESDPPTSSDERERPGDRVAAGPARSQRTGISIGRSRAIKRTPRARIRRSARMGRCSRPTPTWSREERETASDRRTPPPNGPALGGPTPVGRGILRSVP